MKDKDKKPITKEEGRKILADKIKEDIEYIKKVIKKIKDNER